MLRKAPFDKLRRPVSKQEEQRNALRLEAWGPGQGSAQAEHL